MPSQLEIAEAEALKLEPDNRLLLADRLNASVFKDSRIEDAWAVEADRRIEEIESGRAKLIPAAEVIAHLRTLIK